MKRFFCLIFLLIITNSCLQRVEKLGYIIDIDDYRLLQEGVNNKDNVLAIMGSPTIISDYDSNETWIYYSEDIDRFLFFKPKIIKREILVINFDQNNIIKGLKTLDLKNEKNIKFSSKETAVASHKTGFFKDLLGNIGRVSAQ